MSDMAIGMYRHEDPESNVVARLKFDTHNGLFEFWLTDEELTELYHKVANIYQGGD